MLRELRLLAVLVFALVVLVFTSGCSCNTQVPPECTEAGQTWVSPKDGMVLSCIPAGEFLMGSDVDQPGVENEMPQHTVYLDAFWIDQTEVTYAHYQQWMADEDYDDTAYDVPQPCGDGDDHPIGCVTWGDARDYCEWVGRRLPTEAEWEKAARGGLEGMLYPWGDDDPVCTPGATNGVQYLPCDGNTVEVKTFAANGYGLFGMAGNVWEWVFDYYGTDYYDTYAPNEWPANPEGPATGDFRVVRGSSYASLDDWSLRVAIRWPDYNGYYDPAGGFRCALSP